MNIRHTWCIVLRIVDMRVVEVKAFSGPPWELTQRWVNGQLDPLWVVFYSGVGTSSVEAHAAAWDYFDRYAPDDLLALSGRPRVTT